MKTVISVVLPVLNEQDNIPLIYQELKKTFAGLPFTYEIIFVDDGSIDRSWAVINELAHQDPAIKGLCFSRNFGHQIALSAGYDHAQGQAIISLDADLQHPPSVIPAMLTTWQEGAHIVYARRTDRQDTFLKKITAHFYYWLLNAVSDIAIPRHVADFRLIDRTVLKEIQRSQERARYLRGMIAWTGLRSAFVDFKPNDRINGTSGYTWKKMFRLAFDGITGFSTFPLKLAAFIGMYVIATGVIMLSIITFDALVYRAHYPLFKWLTTIMYIFMGIQFLLLWLLGEYIDRIYDQLRGRPLYIIAQRTENK
jgi:glycosyltransferase involved in cell wall biosynthesis